MSRSYSLIKRYSQAMTRQGIFRDASSVYAAPVNILMVEGFSFLLLLVEPWYDESVGAGVLTAVAFLSGGRPMWTVRTCSSRFALWGNARLQLATFSLDQRGSFSADEVDRSVTPHTKFFLPWCTVWTWTVKVPFLVNPRPQPGSGHR